MKFIGEIHYIVSWQRVFQGCQKNKDENGRQGEQTVGHDDEGNEAGSREETSTGGRRDVNGVGSSRVDNSFNGHHNSRGNRRSKGKTEPQVNLNLDAWAEATNDAAQLMLETEIHHNRVCIQQLQRWMIPIFLMNAFKKVGNEVTANLL